MVSIKLEKVLSSLNVKDIVNSGGVGARSDAYK